MIGRRNNGIDEGRQYLSMRKRDQVAKKANTATPNMKLFISSKREICEIS